MADKTVADRTVVEMALGTTQWKRIAINSVLSLLWVGFSVNYATAQEGLPQEGIVAQVQESIAQNALTQAEIYDLGVRVQLLPQNQSPRNASLGDILVPLDSLRTASASTSFAELLFNEGSIARVDQNTTFFFRQGLRRFQLPNRVAVNETIFVLESGVALVMSPPNSTGTQVETPEAVITIVAPDSVATRTPTEHQANGLGWRENTLGIISPFRQSEGNGEPKQLPLPVSTTLSASLLSQAAPTDASGFLLPPERSSAVMVAHDATTQTTQVFALTDGDITVANAAGENPTPLIGGQMVAVTDGEVGEVMEFDLESFYRNVPLAAGLGPDQETLVSQEPAPVQVTLNAVRIETLAAVRRQERERDGFTNTFLRDALNGLDAAFPDPDPRVNDRDFNGQRGETNVIIRQDEDSPIDGTFTRDETNNDDVIEATFTPDDDSRDTVNIRGNIDDRTVTIDGQSGRANEVGISGDNAVGEVILNNGRVIRVEVFGVSGEEPEPGESFPGRIIEGIAPDY